jgi:hypothetical protein
MEDARLQTLAATGNSGRNSEGYLPANKGEQIRIVKFVLKLLATPFTGSQGAIVGFRDCITGLQGYRYNENVDNSTPITAPTNTSLG